jgi:hypothetical protein
MTSLRAVLFALAFMCFVAHAFGVPCRVNLQSAGLAIWMLSFLA